VTFKPSLQSGFTPISKTVSVNVFADTVNEGGNETFTVTLSSPNGANLGRATGIGTILEDDADGVSGVSAGIGQGAIVEALAGSQKITVPVTLTNTPAGTVTMDYALAPGTATFSAKAAQGGDYGGKTSGTVTFLAGKGVLKQLTIPIWPGIDPNQSFTITLSGLTGPATLTRTTATITILQRL
jgi:chitinase